MNGYTLIQEARERGLTTAEIYRPYNKLYASIRAFIDPDYFGVSVHDDEDDRWIPMHVNSAQNPKPCRDRFGRPIRRRFKKRDLICHLAADPKDAVQQFRFLVNSSRGRFHLLGWDIDAKNPVEGHEITSDIYLDCFCAEWDYGGHVYIEPSRNRRGKYIWTIIERSSVPAEFNLLLNALSRVLKARYRRNKGDGFDAIKGTLHFDSRDDLTKLFAESDGDINDDHRGVLVTMPLSGALAREAFEVEEHGFMSFVGKRQGRYVNAIPESHLRELLERFSVVEARTLDEDIAKLRRKLDPQSQSVSSTPAASPSIGNTLRVSAPQKGRSSAREKLISKAHAEISGKNRMRFVSSLFFYTHGRYANDAAELVAFYKHEGFAKGDDSPKKEKIRLRRAEEALAAHKADPAVAAKYDSAFWTQLVQRFVTPEVRQHEKVRYRSPRTHAPMLVEDELIAAGLCVLTMSAFAGDRIERFHTCSQEGQLEFYKALTEAGVLKAKFDDKKKRVAVPVMLQLAGLVVVRDAKWVFGGDDKRKGVGKKFGLGPNHPRFGEFVALHGHVVDPESLPCIVNEPVREVA